MVDSHFEPAKEASYANGCQLSYNYVAPLATPGVFSDLPKWIFNPRSPLRFYPRADWQQWRWLMQFMAACTQRQCESSTAELLALAQRSQAIVHENSHDLQLDYSWRDSGKLIIYRNAKQFAKARKQAEFQAGLGSQQQVLFPAQLLELEPSLTPIAGSLAGGVFTPLEEVGDCEQYTRQLFDYLIRQPGFTAHMGVDILKLHREGDEVVSVQSSAGDMQADHVVVAAGVRSVPLLKGTGYTPLVYPLKGYSLTVPIEADAPAGTSPGLSITDYGRRIVYAPLGKRLRIAAMVDIGDTDASLSAGRLKLLRQQVAETFPRLPLDQATEWAGLRPATPTGKPIIGRHPKINNLWMNVGQGALGFTLAAGSAEALAQQLAGEEVSPVYRCFMP
ncbi:FAD-dependent oxidoreductase [Paenalcaligenes niemegkensis]|uniref:FAD-dependent oxidoreductase n=1 Tax=Paenalcaligenes niemegkensis TaxID=2895469 RepID=UPI001EE9488C|nr:FAD-dependent oxidoreductase [Paenalcaligenes niemegkensis]MCQ9618061.1 FAD-dependent oxidoreductase [Paenalcaligenes niemegkensis]